MINHITIHHIIEKDTNLVNQYSSMASGMRCKKASHISIHAENAINQINIFFSLANGYHNVIIPISETKLTIATAKIQYK